MLIIKGKIKQVPLTINIYGNNEATEHFIVKIITDGSVPQPASTSAAQSTVSDTTQTSTATSTESTISIPTTSAVMPASTPAQTTDGSSAVTANESEGTSPTTLLTEVTNGSGGSIPTTSSASQVFIHYFLMFISAYVVLSHWFEEIYLCVWKLLSDNGKIKR